MRNTFIPGDERLDELVEAGKGGNALKIEKPGTLPPPLIVASDPTRPEGAPINAKPTMRYEEATAMLEARTLNRPVLTDQGWVTPAHVLKTQQVA
jgi:hypothetical protein